MAVNAARLVVVIVVGVGILLVWAILEGLSLEWVNWAFARGKDGGYSIGKRMSQAFWILLGGCVIFSIAYALFHSL